MANYQPLSMGNYKPLNEETKLIVLLLVITLFGLLIFSANKNKSCRCKRSVIYRNSELNPYVINNERDMPMWAVNTKRRNRRKFRN
jgi:hypothetical protein